MLATRGSVFCYLERLISSANFGQPQFDSEGGGIFVSITPQEDGNVCGRSENYPILLCIGGIDGTMAVMNDAFSMFSEEDRKRILHELRTAGKTVYRITLH
jgi:hypothetical protein